MTLAGITFGITDATGLGRVSSEMGRLQRFQGILERGVVHAGVSSAVTGRSLSKSLEAEAGSALLAMGQSVIGDIAVKHNLAEGGLAKTLMHAGAGALYSSANGDNITSGAIGGAAGELLASTTGSSELTKLAASTISFATGGSANDISIAGNVSASAVEHNSFMHPKPTWEQEIARQQQLEQAGDIAVDYVKNNPEQALGITTDAASFMSGGPGAVTAKRTAVQAIKTVGSKVAEYFFTTKSQAQKIDQPMTGKIIDYSPTNGIKEGNSGSIAEQGNAVSQTTLPAIQKQALLPNEGKVGSYGTGYGPNDQPVRIKGKWSDNDIKDGLRGRSPKGLGSPDLHHADQMPGSAIHEILPDLHRGNKELHPNKYNQGVTPLMRQKDKQLHWWYRAREEGADQKFPELIYDNNLKK
jgi:hypothetical protein